MSYYSHNENDYIENIRKFETTDPAHADLINAVVQSLVNNDDFLKRILSNHLNDLQNPHGVSRQQLELDNIDNTADVDKPVSYQQQSALDTYYQQSTGYTDQAISDLINGAPETLDTLKEVADAIKENETVVEALDGAIGKKANQAELDTHTENAIIHITSTERTKWNEKLDTTGDSKDNTVTFTSGDSTSPTAWTDVSALISGEKHSSIFNKISTMFKNLRWLYKMLGTTDIAAIGNGTVTGGLFSLNETFTNRIEKLNTNLSDNNIIKKSFSFRYFGEHDLNTLENGFFWVWSSNKDIHLPESTVGYGVTFGNSDNFTVQVVITSTNKLYYRVKYDSTVYGDWQTI